MGSTWDTVGAVAEIFTWVGVGVGALLAGVALILYVADGTWLPVRGLIDDGPDGRVIRWIDDDDRVNEAHLSSHELATLAGKDSADIFYRRGSRARMRLTHGSPAVRVVWRFALAILTLGAVSFVLSMVILFVEG